MINRDEKYIYIKRKKIIVNISLPEITIIEPQGLFKWVSLIVAGVLVAVITM